MCQRHIHVDPDGYNSVPTLHRSRRLLKNCFLPCTIVSVEENISIYCYSADIKIYLLLDDEIDRKIDVTAILFLLVQNTQQTHDWTLIGSGANGIGILNVMLIIWVKANNILLYIWVYYS